MYSPELTLISSSIISNSIGVEEEYEENRLIPIIKVEEIYSNEFYEANAQGFQPTFRCRISALNYENEKELIYMDVRYSIIRTELKGDEMIIVAERKTINVR